MSEPDLLQRTESLSEKIQRLGDRATKPDQKERALYAGKYLECMIDAVLHNQPVFGIEPWHTLQDNLALPAAGEMLLRVNDRNGKPMGPYAAVMTFYYNGFTEELDTILVLCALNQFRKGPEKQVSINISCRSLQNAEFVKACLSKIEALKLEPDEKIILEIHESNAVVKINDKTAGLFKKLGVQFAIDDVGLSMNDVFRLSAFENLADYIKLDRQTVNGHPDDPRALFHILSLAHSLLPRAHMVAEGIQSAEHAREVLNMHPNVRYVQGMNLPDRATFAKQWAALKPTDGANSYQTRMGSD